MDIKWDDKKIKGLRTRIETLLIDDLIANHNYAIEEMAGWCLQLVYAVEELQQRVAELENRR